MKTLRTRLTTLAAGALALSLAITGCGGGNSGGGASGGTVDNSVIVIIDADPETLNPGLTTQTSTLDIQAKVFEGLVWIDSDGVPQPELASSWTVSADELTYTFKLRAGVKWHDGQPFTSADVKWSLESGLAENARAQGVVKNIASIATPDDATVVITLTRPYAPFLQQMKVFDTPILPQHVYGTGDLASNPANRAPIGTGPFKFDSWQTGQTVTLVKNPDYWQSGEPLLDEVIFQIVPEAQNRVNAMLSGEADVLPAMFLPQANVAQLENQPNLNIHKQTSIPSLYFMMMNNTNPILQRVEVRQALAQAIDRPRIVAQAMGGLALPGYGSFGEGFQWAVNPDSSYDKLYPLDPAAAQAKLTAAGVSNATLRLTYDAARPVFQAAAQIIRDNLAQVGVTVTLEPLERSVFSDRVYTQRDFDLTLQSFTSSGDPAIGYNRIYITNTGNNPNVNPTGYSDAQVDELLTTAASVSDLDQRGKAYQDAAVILDAAVPTLVLFDEQQADVNLTRVDGLYAGQNPSDQFQKVSVNS